MKILVQRKLSGLAPAYPSDADEIAKLKYDETYEVTIKQPRNIRFHKKFFALLNLTLVNLPEGFTLTTPDGQELPIKTVDDILWHVKMQTGHWETKYTLGGKVIYEPKSISFAAMDDTEFNDFYQKAVDVILKYFLPHTEQSELEEMVATEF